MRFRFSSLGLTFSGGSVSFCTSYFESSSGSEIFFWIVFPSRLIRAATTYDCGTSTSRSMPIRHVARPSSAWQGTQSPAKVSVTASPSCTPVTVARTGAPLDAFGDDRVSTGSGAGVTFAGRSIFAGGGGGGGGVGDGAGVGESAAVGDAAGFGDLFGFGAFAA